MENILKSIQGAGVTVFAASGDDGVYDCDASASSTKVGVDYPASSPEVIGVGGTRLSHTGGAQLNTGSNWTDAAWSCTSSTTCDRNKGSGGGGGGESVLFKKPKYQTQGIGSQKFTTSTGFKGNFGTQPNRLVPDIAADGDPHSGFNLLTTDPAIRKQCAPPAVVASCGGTRLGVGGTSLAAPESAALFTDMLGSHGAKAGYGNMHPILYDAYAANNHSFRDVRSGSNGKQADVDRGYNDGLSWDLPVTAQKGFDAVSGLGAPLWGKMARYLSFP